MKYFLAVTQNMYTHYYVPSNKEYNIYKNIFVSCFEDGDVMNVKVKRLNDEKFFSLKLGEEVEAFDLLFSLRDAEDRDKIKYFKSSTLDSNILADYYELIDPNTDTSSLRSRNLNTYFDSHSHMDPDLLKEYLQGEDKPKYNAIKVGEKIEKINLDFSSYESLKNSAKINRFYTIHTANTNQIGDKLGFHLGGFCDERGRGGSDLAAEISGYDYLPSDLYLCLMDSQYNFLPLEEKQLEKLYNYLCPPEEMFEAPEEAADEDIDDEYALADYILFFKVDANWPKSGDDLKVRYEWCYPLCIEKKPSFQFFDDLFVVEGFDRIHNLITLKLNRGKSDELINVKVDEEFKIDFDYYDTPGNDHSYRVGTASFMFRHVNLVTNTLPGKLVFHNKYINGGAVVTDEEVSLGTITDDVENGPTIQNAADDDCGVFAIDKEAGLILLYGLRQDEDKVVEYYFPVWFDKPYEENVTFNDENGKFEILNTVRYEK
ncbi:MAG: hypothetical protein IJK27_04120 [Bacilli bacterium]|nr:hypothetical protein [Bacilli bacterium]